MVRSAVLAVVAATAGCSADPGQRYTLAVTPTAATLAEATSLAVTLRRDDGRGHGDFRFTLPQPAPTPPWRLDVRTGAWGRAAFTVDVEADVAALAIARGSGTPAGETITVTLTDVLATDGGGSDAHVDDLATPLDAARFDAALFDAAGLDQTLVTPPDLAQPDLTSPLDFACPMSTVAGTLQADATVGNGAPDLNFGGFGIANVASGFGLLRFDVTALPALADVRAARLTLSYAQKASDCGPSCGSCDGIEKAGVLQLRYLRSDWTEGTGNEIGGSDPGAVTWNHRATGANWDSGPPPASGAGFGPTGTGDRSDPIAAIIHSPKANVTFTVEDPALPLLNHKWRNGNVISFEVEPLGGAVFIFATKEWPTTAGCTGAAPPIATLSIDYCK